jgi:RNA polymerase sigma-70 factor (ECF subfamily)
MAHRQRQRRDRHVFDEETINAVASEFENRLNDQDDRLAALSHCMGELGGDGRALLQKRYRDGQAVQEIAGEIGHTANRVAVRLHRLRIALMECIKRRELPTKVAEAGA